MEGLKFSDGRTSVIIDRSGFEYNGRRVNWQDIQSCTEKEEALVGLDVGYHFRVYLALQLATGLIEIAETDLPDKPFMALRIVMKEVLPDKVKLHRPRYLKFGPEECEFTLLMAGFLGQIGLPEASMFAYEKAVELIEYYHNPRHILLCEPLEALSALLKGSDPKKAAELLSRAQAIRNYPKKDKPFVQGLAEAFRQKSKKERLKQALEQFRKTKGREPRPVEKARIWAGIENGD